MKQRALVYGLAVLAFALPAISSATATLPAGFPAESIWISKTNVVGGETVNISTILYNSSDTSISGTVTFNVDGTSVGTESFDLDAGKAAIESISWKATSGAHKFSASIEKVIGKNGPVSISVSESKTNALEISIAEPPLPTAIVQTVNVVSTVAKDVAKTSLPLIAKTAQTALNAAENFRNAGLKFAENNLAKQSAQNTKDAATAGKKSASSSPLPAQGGAQSNDVINDPSAQFFSKMFQLASPAILFTFGSRAVFYPLLCLLALFVLYALGRVVNKPKY